MERTRSQGPGRYDQPATNHWRRLTMHSIKRLLLAAVLVVTALSLSATAVLAAPANPPNCMGKDMGAWARADGSGWGRFVAEQAQSASPFGATNWGQAMVAHLAGDYYDPPNGITCQ